MGNPGSMRSSVSRSETDTFAVTSRDGTTIAGSVGGKGPPVVLVHGASGSDFSWALVRPFEERHTVYAIQRRGRGNSGDGTDYSVQREGEDVAAVVDSIGQVAGLVGHSFGANCCLEASLLTTNLTRLVLYEPAVAWPIDEPALRKVDALVAAGRPEEAALTVPTLRGDKGGRGTRREGPTEPRVLQYDVRGEGEPVVLVRGA